MPVVAAAALAGCAVLGTYMPVVEQFGVYKLDINQGNYLSQDQVDRLKVGQTKQQVRAILGTPLVVSAFRRISGTTSTSSSGRAGRSSTAISPCTSSTTSSRGGRATRCRRRWPRSTARRRRSRCRREPSASDKGFFGWFLDIFRK